MKIVIGERGGHSIPLRALRYKSVDAAIRIDLVRLIRGTCALSGIMEGWRRLLERNGLRIGQWDTVAMAVEYELAVFIRLEHL